MARQIAAERVRTTEDGFGARQVYEDAHGRVERLHVISALATPQAEQAIRTRSARLIEMNSPLLVRVHGVERNGDGLWITTEGPKGTPLSIVLDAMELGTLRLSDAASLKVAAAIVRSVAALHEASGMDPHGALSPAHILLLPDGAAMLNGAMFAGALQGLQYNREQFWREFGLALPPAANIPRFDQRADVSQLGAAVLAVLLRRRLRSDEYPRSANELVIAATQRLSFEQPFSMSLRAWLQDTLQLRTRVVFDSAREAAHAFIQIVREHGLA